ncbi:surface protein, putative [Bodo saltans]|uniref:Surface protein, putative n=1 Tax=Bodo saltans TaxID=75058 RepID=A0A0S4J9B8_BODSA|nr:surface protein, putative [Bodo saltans]|eukprot:CUG86812.1 surface protein, putative [Bodo saltans]
MKFLWFAAVVAPLILIATCLEATPQERKQRTTDEVLPFSVVTFPRTASRDKEYLSKSILKDRVPGGFSTFVAHMYTAKDPIHHFSVLQPKRGCGTLDTPGMTADASGGCDVATNGGFFIPGDDVVDHKCIGPLVSNGYWRHHEHRNNVMFGVRAPHDGDTTVSYFFGYMDEETMEASRWLQLVSGVVWLVKDGKVNVQNSMKYENFTAERSGTGETFRNLRAPRLAVGITKTGELILLAIDGSEPDWEGLTLDDVAQVLVGLGAVQAINLDGGGSVSVFEGDDIVNVPSDVCPNTTFPKYRCARKVSSVMCLHAYANPRITRTATRHRSQTILPSFTTFTVSVSQHAQLEGAPQSWMSSEGLQRGAILVAEVIIPLAIVMWVGWHLLLKWRQYHAAAGDRVRLAGPDTESDGEASDVGGDVAVEPDVELRPELASKVVETV